MIVANSRSSHCRYWQDLRKIWQRKRVMVTKDLFLLIAKCKEITNAVT